VSARAGDHITGKTIVVTGAGSGFGRLLAEKTAALGARLGACDIDGDALADLESDEVAIGVVDVTDLPAMREFAGGIVERFGAIDVIVNNAGVMPLAFFADHAIAAEAWHRCIDINIKGVLNGIIAVHDQMIAQGRGHVVNISSVYGNHGVGGAAVYGASKAAVNMLSESLRQESLGAIKVTNVRPTGVPGTGLGAGVLNMAAVDPVLGANRDQFYDKVTQVLSGDAPEHLANADSIGYAVLAPDLLVDQVIHAIDQPWGVVISDVTVRASNDDYVV
jgi:NADP-dependent 3-hydroxy acid dehydrogenase YdfG